jgi:PAS domain S-box-containing protein
MTNTPLTRHQLFTSLQGRIVLFFALVATGVGVFTIYLIGAARSTKENRRQVQQVYYPVTENLEQLQGDFERYIFLIREDIYRKDTASAWHRDQLRDVSLGPATITLRAQRDAFTPSRQPLIDSLDRILIRAEQDVTVIERWINDHYLNASTDSAFLAGLVHEEQTFLLPQLEQLNGLEERYRLYGESLSSDIDVQLNYGLDLIGRSASRSLVTWSVISSLIFITLLAGGYWLIRKLRKSLSGAIEILNKLVRGEVSGNAEAGDDEFRPIIEAANKLSDNLQLASEFARSIGEGDVHHEFRAATEHDILGNSLLQMRQKLKAINEEDAMRNWSTAGLAKFADIMRRHDDYRELAIILISELVKYTKSNQGGMFILNQDDEKDPYLELIACYAFERKKYLQKRVETGTGLVGQCFMERRTIFLKEVPQDYVSITSGLGGANPSSLLIVPLRVNDQIEGVLEIASFKEYKDHEIGFVEQVGEIIASTISNERINYKTRKLLEESQQHAEELRAQEEEMRQNMEEMQATQEQMHRQTEEMRKIQEHLALEKSMFNVLMEYLPDRITYKDRQSRILRINRAKAERFKMSPEEMMGKTDYDFFSKEHADKAFREEQELIRSGVPLLNIEERAVFANGDVSWASTSRIPFRNDSHKTVGMFIITKDVTQLKTAELTIKDRERVIQRLLDGMPVFRFTVGRDGLIHDVWKAVNLPALPALNSISVEKGLPEVYDLIRQEGLNDTDLICKGVLEINGEKEVFKYYLFRESAHDGVFLGFGLKQ